MAIHPVDIIYSLSDDGNDEFIEDFDIMNDNDKIQFISSVNDKGECVLHATIKNNNLLLFSFFLDESNYLNILSTILSYKIYNEQSLLHYMIHNNSSNDMISLFFQYQSYIEQIDSNGQTPLHYAVKQNNIFATKLFITSSSIKVKDNNGLNELDLAILLSNKEIIEIITNEVNWITYPNDDKFRLLTGICISKNTDILDYLIQEHNISLKLKESSSKQNILHKAVQCDIDLSHLFLYNDIISIINDCDSIGRTPLHIAANINSEVKCKILLENNADPFILDKKYLTPLHYATSSGNSFHIILNYIIKVNKLSNISDLCEITTRRGPKKTYLHIAASYSQVDNFKTLLEVIGDKLNPNAKDKYGNTVLYYCIIYGINDCLNHYVKKIKEIGKVFDILKDDKIIHSFILQPWNLIHFNLIRSICNFNDFIDALSKPNIQGIYPIHIAASCGNTYFLKFESSRIKNCKDSMGNTAVHYACYYNQLEFLKEVLQEYSDCLSWENNNGQLPIELAYNNSASNIIMANQEFDYSHRDNDGNNIVLHSAACKDPTALLMALSFQDPASINNIGQNILHRIVQINNSYKLFENALNELLLDDKIDINSQDNAGLTPLHILCLYQNDIEYLNLLLNNNANVSISDINGDTVFHYCAYKKKYLFLKTLINHSSIKQNIIKYYNNNNKTALDIAIYYNHIQEAKLLIQTIDDINIGYPLHIAVIQGNIECVDILLQYNYNINRTNDKGKTPIFYACKRKNKEMVELLLEEGASLSSKQKIFLSKNGWLGVVHDFISEQNISNKLSDSTIYDTPVIENYNGVYINGESDSINDNISDNDTNDLNNKNDNVKDTISNIENENENKIDNEIDNSIDNKNNTDLLLNNIAVSNSKTISNIDNDTCIDNEIDNDNDNDNELNDFIIINCKDKEQEVTPDNEISLLSECGINHNYSSILQNLCENNEDVSNILFYKGIVPIGNTNNPIWNVVHKKITEMPKVMEIKNKSYEKETSVLNDYTKELEELEKRKLILQESITKQKEKIETIEDHIITWNSFSNKYKNYSNTSLHLKQIEKDLTIKLEKQIQTNVEEFTNIKQDNNNNDILPLSLIFNSIGLSYDSISSLLHCDAEYYFYDWDESECQNFQEGKDLQYCKEMLKDKLIPYSTHEKHCSVCQCNTVDELYELCKDNNLNIDYNILKQYNINGKRILHITINDVIIYLKYPKDKAREFTKSIRYLKKLHNENKIQTILEIQKKNDNNKKTTKYKWINNII